jgi:hypothetical protein
MPDYTALRASAEAADQQLRTGPKEWPGRPSAQRLAFFLAATPAVVLALLDELEANR